MGRDRNLTGSMADGAKRFSLISLAALSCLTAACNAGTEATAAPSLGERLQGNWSLHTVSSDQGFVRTEDASLAVYRTTMHYKYNVSWECDPALPCTISPPMARGNYFEGVFTDLGDSLALRDALEPVSFRNVKDSTAEMHAGGFVFVLRRQ